MQMQEECELNNIIIVASCTVFQWIFFLFCHFFLFILVMLTLDFRTENQCVAFPCACGGRLFAGRLGRTDRTQRACNQCASGCA